MRYPLARVRRRGRGPFTDDEWELILRIYDMIRHYPDLLDELAERWLDRIADRYRRRRLFTDDEEAFIIERAGVLEQYQDQLAQRVRRLQAAKDQEALDKAGSGSDLLLTVAL